MASEKITAMPDLAGGQIPTDVLPLVDLSAIPANQNVKSSLNDLFSVVTKNITDRAIRFQAPGSAPAVSGASQGGIYFDGTDFKVSENGGAWTNVVTAGLITSSGLTQSTARILGRTTAGTGAVEEISIGAGLTLAAGQLTASGGASPGGVSTNIQYNAGGGTFGGSNSFVFNPAISPTVDLVTTGAAVTALRVTGNAAQTAEIILVRQGGDNGAALLTLQQGVLSSLTNNFPFRFENSSGTLIAGIATTPATGNYRFVIPGQNNNSPGYVCGGINSGHGIGVDSTGTYLAVFASNAPCLWGDGGSGRVVVNSAFSLVFTANPANTPDIGLFRQASGVLRVTNGTTGGGQLLLGTSTDTATGQLHVISQATGRNAAQFFSASGSTFAPVVSVVTATTTNSDTTHTISLRARSTGTPANGFGGTINLSAQTSTTVDVQAGEIRWNWTNATHSARTSEIRVSVVAGGTAVDVLDIDSSALTVLNREFRLTAVGGGNNYLGLRAPNVVASNQVYTLPPFPAALNYSLTSDLSGNLSWVPTTGGAFSPSVQDGRLSLSTDPIANTSVGSTLYFVPYVGNSIALYNGSSWSLRTFSTISFALSGLRPHVNYDIFAYWNGSAVALEALPWGIATEYNISNITGGADTIINFTAAVGSNPFAIGDQVAIFGTTGTNASLVNSTWTVTAIGGSNPNYTVTLGYMNTSGGTPSFASGKIRASINTRNPVTPLARVDGVLINLNDNTRRYIGTIRITGNSGESANSALQRYVYNYNNRVRKFMFNSEPASSWAYAVSAWRPFNGLGTNRVECVIGVADQALLVNACGMGQSAAANGFGLISVGFDNMTLTASSTTGRMYLAAQGPLTSINQFLPGYGTYEDITSEGYHYFVPLERANGGAGSTTFASFSTQLRNAGIAGDIWA